MFGYNVAMSKHIQYHKDGSVWAKGEMVADVMQGYWEWFRKDGSKMRSGYFKKNKQIGEWITYDKDGKVVKVTNMDKRLR
jgi:antitoxin component YwqK of YwqJK toxin-antitoxin module